MKKKHHKFKPLQELYDRGDTLLKSKAVGLMKASLKESTIDQALAVDPSRDMKIEGHVQLSNSENTVERQDQDVFDCQGDDNSCISKDDGTVMTSSDQVGGEAHKIVTSSAASVSSACPDVLEKSSNLLSVSNGSPTATTQDPCLHNQSLLHGDGPDELVDVRLCDICGDAGRETLLVLCSKCSDGAEHIYCMSPKMDEVPEGDWFCEECLLMQDPKRQRQVMTETPDNTSKPSCLKEPSQGSPTINSAIQHDGKMKTNHSSKASCISDKRLGLAVDVRSKTKKGIVDKNVQPLKTSGLGGKSQLSHRPSLKNMNVKKNAARQVSSFVVPAKKMVKQACSSDHRSSKPEQQSCGGSFNNKKVLDCSDSKLEVQRLKEDIRQRRRSAKDKANCELKKDHPDKKVFKSLSLSGASSIPPDVSNKQSSPISTIKGGRCGSKRKVTEKNNSLDNKTNQVCLPFSGSSLTKVSSSRTKVVPEIVKAEYSPIKSVEDKSAIQDNGNKNVEAFGSLVLEGKNHVKTSGTVSQPTKIAPVVDENNLPCDSSYAINSPAKNVSADPDLRMSLFLQRAELANINRNDNDVAFFKFQNMEVKPTLDLLNLDNVVPNVTSAVPESRCTWRGTFNVEKSGKLHTDCYGIQAHLSTCASSKIADLVLKFSNELLLKEVPRLHIWPIQFQKKIPTEQDIALYFFAQDLCSYERSYRMLLEGMTNNDIALEANFGGFQLLVFPSSLLPSISQCWNSLPFLWGLFRMKNFDDSDVPDMNVVTANQGVYSPVAFRSENKFVSALLSGGSSQLHTSSMHEPKSDSPVVLQSSALIKSGEQSNEHEVPSLKKHTTILNGHDVQDDTITSVRDWSKEDSGGGLHSYDLQKNITFSDINMRSPRKTSIIQSDQVKREYTTEIGLCSSGSSKDHFTASEFWQGLDVVSGNSFSLDSGPSGSSDGGGCAKSADELQIEPSENPRSYNTLNFDPYLDKKSGLDEIDLNLALGFPSKSEYQPKIPLDVDRDGSLSLVLSLGLPCSTS